MFCGNCGTKIEGTERFCPECGALVLIEETPATKKEEEYVNELPKADEASEKAPVQQEPKEPVYQQPEEQPVQEKNYCPKCNTEVHKEEAFCPECGFALKATSEKAPEEKQKKSKAPIIVLIISLAALLTIAIVLIFVLAFGNFSEDQGEEEIVFSTEAEENAEEVPEAEVATYEQETAVFVESEDEYLFPSDSEYITEYDLRGKTQEEVRLILNEIYARHGKIFTTEKNIKYFEAQSWYEPDEYFHEGSFNEIEAENRDFIVSYEKERGWR